MDMNAVSTQPKSNYLFLGILVVIVLIASFFGGIAYQKSMHATATTAASGAARTARFGGGARRGGFGTVAAISGSSITLTLRSGASTTFTITNSTKVTNNGASASVSDIQVGDRVAITRDTTNTSQADSIILNPSFGGGPGGSSSSGSSSLNVPTQTN